MKKFILHILIIVISPLLCNGQLDSFLSGVSDFNKGDFSNAVEKLSDVIADNTQSYTGRAYLYRGISFYNLNNPQKALGDLLKAGELNVPEASLWISKTYALQNDSENAVKILKKYIEKNPYCNLFSLTSDKAFQFIHQSDEWINFTDNLHETPLQQTVNTTKYYIGQKKSEQALAAMASLDENSNNLPVFRSLRSEIYQLEGNTALAMVELKSALEGNPENTDYRLQYAQLLMSNGSFQKSIELLTSLIDETPDNFELYKIVSEANYMNENYEEARKSISLYLKYLENDTSGIYFLAKTNFMLQDYTNTLRQLNTLMKNNKVKPEWFLLRGKTYFETNTYPHAKEDLSMYLDLIPDNAEANYYLGLSHLKSGDKSLSCYYLERAIRYGYVSAIELVNENCY